MKKTIQNILFIAIVITAATFMSCEIKEEITFNENGSGELAYTYDMSYFLALMPESTEENNSKEKAMDTLIVFNDLMNEKSFKDSISRLPEEQRELMESFKDMKMSMRMDPEEKLMIMSFSWDFENINSMTDLFSKMSKAQSLSGEDKNSEMYNSPMMKTFSGENQNLKYSYNGKSFSRSVSLKKPLTEEEKEQFNGMLSMKEGSKEKTDELKYTIVLNFPKSIKTISNKNVKFSNNRKTVEMSYSFFTYLMDPESLSFELELE